MIIESSSIALTSGHSFIQRYSKEESLKTWVGDVRPDFEGRNANLPLTARQDQVALSDTSKSMQKMIKQQSEESKDCDSVNLEPSEHDKITLKLIEKLLEELTGKKFHIRLGTDIELKAEPPDIPKSQPDAQEAPVQEKAGWGLEYDLHEKYYESEQMDFAAEGVIRTSDGREINFSLDLEMSREFASQYDVSIRAGDAVKVDPLVINFAASAAQLTSEKISFDLNADGSDEEISFVAAGSGLLFLDLNGDQIVNNGSELFGPQSGNGFVQLSQYDATGDNWVDENDPVFGSLRIWARDQQGTDLYYSLAQAGVGAIYLGNAESPYTLKDQNNQTSGQITQTGIAVKENGSVITVQDVDLSI